MLEGYRPRNADAVKCSVTIQLTQPGQAGSL
jgi:hypothetical protein